MKYSTSSGSESLSCNFNSGNKKFLGISVKRPSKFLTPIASIISLRSLSVDGMYGELVIKLFFHILLHLKDLKAPQNH